MFRRVYLRIVWSSRALHLLGCAERTAAATAWLNECSFLMHTKSGVKICSTCTVGVSGPVASAGTEDYLLTCFCYPFSELWLTCAGL